jgi:hypothetical protein
VQDRLVEPHFTEPVLADRLVAQFTVTEEPTRSVRYGYRFSSGARAPAGLGNRTNAVETRTSQIASTRQPESEVVRHPVTPQPCGQHPTRPTRQGWSLPLLSLGCYLVRCQGRGFLAVNSRATDAE